MRIGALPLTVRVPLMVAGLMIIVGTIASERVLSRLAETQQLHLRDLASLYLDGLSVAVLPAALRGNVWETYEALDRATRQDRRLHALVTTVVLENGEVLASSAPERFPTGAPGGAAFDNVPTADGLVLSGASTSVNVQAPIRYQGDWIARVHAELDVSDLLAERKTAILYLILGNALATLVLAIAGYFVVRRMLRPMSLITEHMQGGDGAPQLIPESEIPRGENELSSLMRTYNTLVLAERERSENARRAAEHERLVSLGRLAASVAHEINNPLGGMLNTLDTMKRYGERPGVVPSSIALLERGLLGIRTVVRALLQTHRSDEATLTLTTADFDDLRLLISPEVRRLEQTIDWQVDLGRTTVLPLANGPVRQIALNLLLNASAAAGQQGHVVFEVTIESAWLQIAVSDNGPGVPAEARSRLFEDLPARDGEGLGLGVVRQRAAELSAKIEIGHSSGSHTKIRVTIPFERGGEEAA